MASIRRYLSVIPLLITIIAAKSALALEPAAIYAKAKEFTVQIDGEETGTGTIVERSGNTYTVLTCWHVMDTPGSYSVTTSNGSTYQVTKVQNLPNADIAVITFETRDTYPVAELGSSSNRGLSYNRLGEATKAIADYTEVIRLDSQNADAYYRRGATYVDLGKYEQALVDLDEAINLNPRNADAYFYRGNSYADLGNRQQAVVDFQQAASLYQERGDAESYQTMIGLIEISEQLEESEQRMEESEQRLRQVEELRQQLN